MTNTRKALEIAIEALEDANDYIANECSMSETYNDVIQACKEALEQPEQKNEASSLQEPVLYIDQGGLDGHATWAQPNACQNTDIPLYTHPAPSWQGLSLNEINDGRDKIENDEDIILDDAFVYGAQWAEQVLRIKNGL